MHDIDVNRINTYRAVHFQIKVEKKKYTEEDSRQTRSSLKERKSNGNLSLLKSSWFLYISKDNLSGII